jgi:hypothetical protein
MSQSMDGLVARRLTRDYRAHLRAIQISSRTVFSYCEGKRNDPYIYSELIARAKSESSNFYNVYRIEEITGTGGKRELTRLYNYFRKRSLLMSTFKGKSFCCVFFMDKDIDDLRRALARSDHVFYTTLYDLESHIYCDSDLRRAIAVCLSIDIRHVPLMYNNTREWLEAKALGWEEWVTLCVYSTLYKVDCGCGYGRPSAINPSPLDSADARAFENFKGSLERKSKVSREVFSSRFSAVQRIVHRLKVRGSLSSIFKGKWLDNIISAELEDTFKGKPVDLQVIGPRLLAAATTTFDFSSDWALQHIDKLSILISSAAAQT